MLKAPNNEYEIARSGMEYKLALQAIRKVVRNGKRTAYEQVTEIENIVRSMEEDLKKRSGCYDNGGEDRVPAEPSNGNDKSKSNGFD